MITENNVTNSKDETFRLGFNFAKELNNGDTIAFYGDLGSGKTEFIKGICKYFEVKDIVSSPTFTIINKYNGKIHSIPLTIYHLDLYRIKNKEELLDVGFNDCIFNEDGLKLIEWSEHYTGNLPDNSYIVKLELTEDVNKRNIKINKIIPIEIE